MIDYNQPVRPKTVYGPVHSWRFGRSLGIDPIVETSVCSFNCIYCQLGNIQRVTAERRVFVPVEHVREDLNQVNWDLVDVVTLSGSGEPTLAANLAEIIAAVRSFTARPLHILTNATLLNLAEVRHQAIGVDVIACKLDAPDEATLRRINRPVPGVTVEQIVEGIVALRKDFSGRLALQIMLLPGSLKDLPAWIPLIRRIRPDEIQLNTPRRPHPAKWQIASRGDHEAKELTGAMKTLKVITHEEARRAADFLRAEAGSDIISVYRSEVGHG